MPSADDSPARLDRVTVAVLLVAALALLVRVVALGERTVHWDEGRVGYWTLRFLATGVFEYRPVAGGPFLYVVDRAVFAALGTSDATARLVVAAVGGLAPLVALVFRGRLRGVETVLLAAVLGASPLFVYYSRFLRADVPLAVFALLAVACCYRAVDTGSKRGLYAAGLAVGLAATTSAFFVGYVACWGVAAALTFDHYRLLGEGAVARERLATAERALRARGRDVASAVGLALAVVLFFYAPRAGGGEGPGLWKPTTFPQVVDAAFAGTVAKFVGVRVVGRRHDGTHPFLPFVRDYAEVLAAVSLVVVGLAAVAFLRDRYGTREPRPIVAFHAYWAGASLFVFPVVTEVSAPWVALHTLVALAVPAAVGAGALVRLGRRAAARDDAASVAAVVVLALALTGHVGAVTASNVYASPSPENPMVHYAQPADDLNPLIEDVSVAIEGNDGTDVVFYGERFVDGYRADADRPPVNDEWGNRLPLPWYFERVGAETDGVYDAAALDERASTPPVVVADPNARSTLDSRLEGTTRGPTASRSGTGKSSST
ncbi:flippase activity-associated protein Agl23 [Haloplanus sp. GCM10025708]|uniref:flippase activity-associated protein Agl23 n=1 Tax=Haloplanus sp. GCM10025708 TaxID=3252679 RepID=UPI0036087603